MGDDGQFVYTIATNVNPHVRLRALMNYTVLASTATIFITPNLHNPKNYSLMKYKLFPVGDRFFILIVTVVFHVPDLYFFVWLVLPGFVRVLLTTPSTKKKVFSFYLILCLSEIFSTIPYQFLVF